ncbi:sugar transferase [Thalassorhabdomicrobium marinisediminis]|uniref:Exopolysaccharide biosynthesis protein n=1 Tax=Thalassorhabdomicrobium marinisediminis TaxID=2170577 RepID=A0A2T7G159_9RHOB|nr:sugar transferase [Thalassorhabdomicrobium marinisediminis]PVA08154.1 exopolysaccharide biosynthesis protein [Thalassorhabdomicrobium marinisediminis]
MLDQNVEVPLAPDSTSFEKQFEKDNEQGPSRLYNVYGKRAFDIVLSLIALPFVIAILLPVVVVGLFTGGQVFFLQDRIGKDGRVFRCIKVRTMVVDADKRLAELCASDPAIAEEWETNQKLANDPRVNRWGKFLRKTSIDELPQVFNVLRGDMSFVGPRPFMASQKAMYMAAGGQHYFKVRPGISGNWQVEGRGDSSFLSRIAFDRAYVQRLSFREDLRITAKTLKVLLRMTGN